MSRRLVPLTLDVLQDLPDACRRCVFWELDPVSGERAAAVGDPALDKEAWVSATLLEWGSLGRLAYVDDVPRGYVMYAPAHLVPRAGSFPTAPVSGDAVLLMTARVEPGFGGGGLGRMLVQGAAKDLTRRGVRAIEAFGLASAPASGGPSRRVHGADTDPEDLLRPPGCVLPADFLLAVGFKTVRPHHRYPRLRLDLRTALAWREDVEQAIERLLGSVRQPVLSR